MACCSTSCSDGVAEQVRAAVAVAADGAGSVLRASAGIEADVEDYDQVAIVVNAATERPNNGEAFERFTSSGPLAVLPVTGGGYAVVWAVAPARAAELMALDEAGLRRGAAQRVRLARGPLDAHRPPQLPIHSRCRAPKKPSPDAWCSSAMPRRRCIRWRARVSISACAMRPRWRRCWRRPSRAPISRPSSANCSKSSPRGAPRIATASRDSPTAS